MIYYNLHNSVVVLRLRRGSTQTMEKEEKIKWTRIYL